MVRDFAADLREVANDPNPDFEINTTGIEYILCVLKNRHTNEEDRALAKDVMNRFVHWYADNRHDCCMPAHGMERMPPLSEFKRAGFGL